MDRVTAVFDDRYDAERAVDWLRSRGVPNDHISVIAREGDTVRDTGGYDHDREHSTGSEVAKGAGIGLLGGAGTGVVFGLAAAALPGIGPLIAAGELAAALGLYGGAAAAGAIVGGTSGTIAGALAGWGIDEDHARHYGEEIERGATFVAANLDGTTLTRTEVEEAFRGFNGRYYDRTRAAA